MTKTDWNASHYLLYGDERTRPSIDLVAKIHVESPSTVVDLGCGPGSSTQVLRKRWPSADICGIDNSPAMIDAARSVVFPDSKQYLRNCSHSRAFTSENSLGSTRDRMGGPLSELTMESPAAYCDILAPLATKLDIWETEYFHVLQNPDAIVDWIASTGLRPILSVLTAEAERTALVARLRERVHTVYQPQVDGKVLFPFRRTFVVAYR